MEYIIHYLAYTPGSHFLFTSLDFWIFLCLALGGFSLCYRNPQARNNFLFFCSLFFYYKVGGYFIFILLLSITLNFGLGLQIASCSNRGRRWWLGIGVLANLAMLGFFKYKMIPFIGFSFVTLQAISYLADVKRGHTEVCRNIGDFGFYLCFFPQLVAGPIIRAGQFMPQLKKHYMLSSTEFSVALGMILTGLIKKMVIADTIAMHFAAPVFDHPQLFSSFENWMAMYAFAIRIYCDFSGYTDIAIGIAALFGFQLPVNFRSPYKASSLSDFWHRWHITLSTWFRDYVYIPLGGNRKGKAVMVISLMITMILAALWHGAGWGFLLWGGLHGVSLCIEKLSRWNIWVEKNRFTRILGWVVTFHVVCFGWIFFRCHSLENTIAMFNTMFSMKGWEHIPEIVQHYLFPFSLMLLAIISMLLVKERHKRTLSRIFYNLPLWSKFACTIAVALLILLVGQTQTQDFIYFQF